MLKIIIYYEKVSVTSNFFWNYSKFAENENAIVKPERQVVKCLVIIEK